MDSLSSSQILKIPIYDRKLTIDVTNDVKGTSIYHMGLDIDEHPELIEMMESQQSKANVFTNDSGELFLIIDERETNLNTISHECYHLTHEILNEAGIPFNNSTEEAYAYLMGWLTEQVYEVINNN